ncbi:thyrotropin-releasing hormone receptor-like [Dreissena polymorpha]|uniref:G-protein coupled receptors family 1 profile domain-containing protein n=1 Tax=Dreissena polymorpha TaxID=45954 RepID=A0A9D4GLE5_DREPO|nr:thyrotropin-releasing hormone receptor-like [Dreissena polymorpha]KAH3819042.1 hypothetical protein DPMN_120772 [Dreissena polymorpha]
MEIFHNTTGSSNETLEDGVILERIHRDLVADFIPLMVWLGVASVIGIVGNIVTIIFHGWKSRPSSTMVFITWLAAADLLVCLLMIEQILDLHLNVYFTSPVHCKAKYFFIYVGVYWSCMSLTLISVDRFKKVCRPISKQFSEKSSRYASMIVVLISIIVSLRIVFALDISEVEVITTDGSGQTAVGHDCYFTNDIDLKTFVSVCHAIDFLFLLFCLTTMLICYGRLFVHIKKHTEQMADWNGGAAIVSSTSHKADSALENADRRITIMMALITVWFIICYIPYVAINLYFKFNSSSIHRDVLNMGIQFALRLPYLNSVINPIVFICLNPKYRYFVKHQLCKCKEMSTSNNEQNEMSGNTLLSLSNQTTFNLR